MANYLHQKSQNGLEPEENPFHPIRKNVWGETNQNPAQITKKQHQQQENNCLLLIIRKNDQKPAQITKQQQQ